MKEGNKMLILKATNGTEVKVYNNTKNLKVGDQVVIIDEKGFLIPHWEEKDHSENYQFKTEVLKINDCGDNDIYIKTELSGAYHYSKVFKLKR